MDKQRLDRMMYDFLDMVESQIHGDISKVDAKELGEVVDMAKDCAELMKYIDESNYYCKITDAMDKNKDSENMDYIEKYIPEARKYYRPYNTRMYYTPIDDGSRHSMYTDGSHVYNPKEGRSPIARRYYMDIKDGSDVNMKNNSLERYIVDLEADLTEMARGMDDQAKNTMKQKLNAAIGKI